MAVLGSPQLHLQVPYPTVQEEGILNVSRPEVTARCRIAAASGRVVVVEWIDRAAPPQAVPRTAITHSADVLNGFTFIATLLDVPGPAPNGIG